MNKKLKIFLFTFLYVPITTVLLGETLFIFHHFYKFNTLFDSRSLEPDSELGWTSRADFSLDYQTLDAGGASYEINYHTVAKGFKEYGDVSTTKKKLLVIGDSFTQARQVSNDKTYYSYIDRDKYEVFVYGAGGHGSYQELQILLKYWDQIKPDLVVWQFCRNDLADNYFPIDSASAFSGIILDRPYRKFRRSDKDNFYSFSRIFWPSRFLDFTLSKMLSRFNDKDIWKELEKEGKGHKDLKGSIAETAEILKLVRSKIGKVPVVSFGVDSHPLYLEIFRNLSESVNFHYLDSIPLSIQRVERSGTIVRALDGGHWNERGHQIAGLQLNSSLKVLDRRQR
ncbi:MAG: SGNH/GDSL hydrolase family protein [Halobacteriovoraceae bacterium]|jgi:hypothetical protein|nr:SGNH/GDSL hydrolase family protein [Halobacteriovoraceae bacterium]MBT5092854.1 SGNH/GDSL hydrolase family protein [Halobacteriovoraceae bacterium]